MQKRTQKMFKKIVSNLPFSPGLLNNLVFYTHRLKQENTTRQLGVGFLLLALLLQVIFWAVPPAASVSASENDIVYGGLGTNFDTAKARMLQVYRDDRDRFGNTGFQDLFTGLFGITEQDLLSSVARKVDTQDRELKSLGRYPHFTAAQGEVTVKTPQGRVYYLRPIHLWPWASRYKDALYIPGKDIYILYNCGNIVTRHYPTPEVSISKASSPAADSKVRPGDDITYHLSFRNSGKASAADIIVKDATPDHMYRKASQTDNNPDAPTATVGQFPGRGEVEYFYWRRSLILPDTTENLNLTFTVKSDAPDGATICNLAVIDYQGGSDQSDERICHTVEVPPVPPPPQEAPAVPQPAPEAPSVTQAKRAQNLSAAEDDPAHDNAHRTLAKPGDRIRYILSLTNNGPESIENYAVPSESILDILDYAELVDRGTASFNETTKELNWEPLTLKGKETVELTFEVQVKSDIPKTGSGSSDPSRFDLVMSNLYGNRVEIRLPGAPEKIVEQASGKLPRTGPGTPVLLSLVAVAVASFLRARNGLMIRELNLIKEKQLAE
jgi:uncharacterized repeat protein (TIGR01451 family)